MNSKSIWGKKEVSFVEKSEWNQNQGIEAEEFIQVVLNKVDKMIEKLNAELTELKNQFTIDPIHFLEWNVEKVVKTQQTIVRYNQARRMLSNNSLNNWEAKHQNLVGKIRNAVMGEAINPSSSSNAGHNLTARYKLAADASFVSQDNWNGEALSNVIALTLISMSESKEVVFLI